MMKVRLCPMALKAVSFEIDDLIGKEGEVVERIPDGSWIVQFGRNRTYAFPEHYLGEKVLEITFDDTHVEPPVPKGIKKPPVKRRKRTVKTKVTLEEPKKLIDMSSKDQKEIVKIISELKEPVKKTDGRSN